MPTGSPRAEALSLRRDMVAPLTYVRDNRVVGTQSTGNLPLKTVREVIARFVHPLETETTIGDRTIRVRSEYEVWPLFLHTLAEVGGLLVGGRARRWGLTPEGARFLDASLLLQVLVLFTFWWERADWLIAYPFEGMGESLPLRFMETTLAHLLSLSVDTRILFESFADRLIRETRPKWTAPDTTCAWTKCIRRTLIGLWRFVRKATRV